jgi:beta-lactam-binding protein with PASTA domain
MFKYITKKPLWVNILFGIGLVLIIFFIFFLSLNWITKHGESKTVPVVTGKNIDDVTEMLEEGGFEVVIQDSVYYDSLPPGMVIKQIPEADEVVKVNRTVYVTVNRFIPPDIDMPNLVGSSYRNAEMILRNSGLRLGDTTYKTDFAKNSVLEQLVNGQPIRAGAKVRMGTVVDLVLSSGVGDAVVPVPKLVGLTYAEARAQLEGAGFIVVPYPNANVRDTSAAFIWRQNPSHKTEDGLPIRIRTGQLIEVFLQVDPVADSLTTGQPRTPEENEYR